MTRSLSGGKEDVSLKTTKNILTISIVSILLFIALFVVISEFGFGWRYDALTSGSMKPTLEVGDLIITKPVDLEDVKVGDVVSFIVRGERTTHRVVKVDKDGTFIWLQTKGDNNKEPDQYLVTSSGSGFSRVIARVPQIGYSVIVLSQAWFFWLTLTALVVFVIIMAVVPLIRKGIKEEVHIGKSETI